MVSPHDNNGGTMVPPGRSAGRVPFLLAAMTASAVAAGVTFAFGHARLSGVWALLTLYWGLWALRPERSQSCRPFRPSATNADEYSRRG